MASTTKTSQSSSTVAPWLQLYFVLGSLLGLVLIVVGSTTLLNVGLTSTILRPVNQQRFERMPPVPPVDVSEVAQNESLTQAERDALQAWEKEFVAWEQSQNEIDYEAEARKRSMANAIALLITGIPVFGVHAPWVFRKTRS